LGYGHGAIVKSPPELVQLGSAEVVEMNNQYLES